VVDIQGCDKNPLKGFKSSGSSPLCHVISNEKGQFTFPSIPPGSYKVVPHYEGPHSIKFDVRPVEINFTVEHKSLRIGTEFKVSSPVFIFHTCSVVYLISYSGTMFLHLVTSIPSHCPI
jgi:hypothetical protein